MRAARLLQMLLLLQNRGRLTSRQLAEELEVAPRTILRDVDAMTEAGLPIIVHQGNQGGIELGFNYRTRLTGLAEDEAKALGLILAAQNPMIAALGLESAAKLARAKLIESLPDKSRAHTAKITTQFSLWVDPHDHDPRIQALAKAIQARQIVRLRFASKTERVVHPDKMELERSNWRLHDARRDAWIAMEDWGRLNISARQF
jgi:predicted DNA-binding transcriptional regulator YafY